VECPIAFATFWRRPFDVRLSPELAMKADITDSRFRANGVANAGDRKTKSEVAPVSVR
jgi:hypothetical protein